MSTLQKYTALVLLICIVIAFFWDRNYQRRIASSEASYVQQSRLKAIADNTALSENTLHIPSQNIVVDISEGEYEGDRSYLKTWRRTHTNTPEKGGNTVIVGHRYRNKEQYPLYNIDQLESGDVISLYWEGERYDYSVTDRFTVEENDVSVEDPTDEDILTLYACDWSGRNRLVVRAELQ